MTYPDSCLRGIPNDDFLNEDGTVGAHLFYFKKRFERDDGWIEQSINWQDDDTVADLMFNQRKDDGTFQFTAGVAVLPRQEIDRLNTQPMVRGLLAYERQPIENNPYHGNLLLEAATIKPTMKLIAAGLALAVSKIIPRESST